MEVSGLGLQTASMGMVNAGAADGANAAVAGTASMKVLSMAQDSFETNADALLKALDSAISGLGQSVDVSG